ncbi:helix-turn-helix domain-containing protein, partial [Pseudomonas aeruginosa]|uniref:helix-turn-helix domain-containing protein n=1 Tax=Pseudomonas aeruginosa TaxID=287 RepID=UPI00117AECA5
GRAAPGQLGLPGDAGAGAARVIALRRSGHSITRTAELAGCSPSQVKRIWAAEVSQAEAARMGAFREDALTEADALAAADQEGMKA